MPERSWFDPWTEEETIARGRLEYERIRLTEQKHLADRIREHEVAERALAEAVRAREESERALDEAVRAREEAERAREEAERALAEAVRAREEAERTLAADRAELERLRAELRDLDER